MKALICGSYAYDHIMVFPDHFKNHILPDKIHILNVSFLVPEMRREFGGCAGNIAYNLKLLGSQSGIEAIPMATVGSDFKPYAEWMDKYQINREHLLQLNEQYTGQAFITTDNDANQITAFHPGAMSFSHYNNIAEATGITIGIVSPDGKEGMMEHARQFAAADIPFIFDPGQGMPMFSGDELKEMLSLSQWLTVNDYEMQLFMDKTGLQAGEIAQQLDALIVTMGAKGVEIITRCESYLVPAAPISDIQDPTGCGDAFRAGLMFGIMKKLDWQTTGRIANLMGAIKIEHQGTQNHHFTQNEFCQRYQQSYGQDLNLS